MAIEKGPNSTQVEDAQSWRRKDGKIGSTTEAAQERGKGWWAAAALTSEWSAQKTFSTRASERASERKATTRTIKKSGQEEDERDA